MMPSIRLRVHPTVYTSFEYCILGKEAEASAIQSTIDLEQERNEVDDHESENSVEQLEEGASYTLNFMTLMTRSAKQ